MQTTQGVWVAFVYCFFNDEVKNTVKTKIRSWKISYCIGSVSHNNGYGNGGGGANGNSTNSTRNHSLPTLYSAQVNSGHGSVRGPIRGAATEETIKLPILQETPLLQSQD